MHYAYSSPWQACFIGSCGRAATPASRATLERLGLNMAGGRWQRYRHLIKIAAPWWEATQLAGWRRSDSSLGFSSCSASLTASRGALLAFKPRTQCPCLVRACPPTRLSMRYHGPCCSWPLPTCLPANTARILTCWTGPNRWEPRMSGHRIEPSGLKAMWSLRGPWGLAARVGSSKVGVTCHCFCFAGWVCRRPGPRWVYA